MNGKLILTRTERATMLLLSFSLAAVSIACEVMLFTSQTNTPLDQALAAITGIALVGFQYVFAAIGARFYQARKTLLAMLLFLITAVLFAVSVSGTAGFFESRLQTSDQANTQDSTEYRLQLSTVESLDHQIAALTESAQVSKDAGNTWNAGKLLEQAAILNKQRIEAITALNQVETNQSTTVSALASLVGKYRWAFWFLLAALVDVCPVVAFAVHGVSTQTLFDNAKTTPEQKEKQQHRLPTDRKKQTPTRTGNTPSVEEIKDAVRKHPGGPVGIRLAMREVNTTNYQRTKQAFDELENEGVLVRVGKGYAYTRKAA
jgi:hypothetical protein